MFEHFSDDQRRVLINLDQLYDAWVSAERGLLALPYGMRWRSISGRDYLYKFNDRIGNGSSLGPRSPETENIYDEYLETKRRLQEMSNNASNSLHEQGRLYRALRLPTINSNAAAILREADKRKLLGDHLLVIGTSAMPAYSVEAGGFIDSPYETKDFDFARSSMEKVDGKPVLSMLKAVDSTYTMNTERTFQMRNAKAHEVDFLIAPSLCDNIPSGDGPVAFPLPEQEWLLNGNYVSAVILALDGSPARIVAPDPRWFALQKIWLSQQDKRSALKRPKDEKQGFELLETVYREMPQFPLNEEFISSLPDELEPSFQVWRAGRALERREPSWR